jgi:quercetin dioxygenase-like cupin family protein
VSDRYPFTQRRLSENIILRKFSRDVSETMLEWHRDRQDRVVEVIHGDGWMFQRDNSIPVQISEGSTFKIRANEWHRVIKGKGDLIVKITESKKKKPDGMRSIRKGADSNPKVTKMDFLPDEVLDDIADEIDEGHPGQYSAGPGTKRKKQLDATQADLKSDDPERRARAYRRRDRMEKQAREKSESVKSISESQLRVMINDALEEIKLDTLLNEIEDQINERKRKKKGKKKTKKSGSRKLSKAVKKSLDKKADKRCLTRGSVYSEFRKGLGAYYTSGSRKGMSAHQWAHARVNSANPSKKWAVVKKRKKCPKKKKK